jgi:predicted glycoside hydrolase/deacetylase ChbG (UPF0249 family)
MTLPQKAIVLCADDYGITSAVDGAIRELLARGRLSATSVMVVAPAFQRAEAFALTALRERGAQFQVGLHLTLTAPFRPLTPRFRPLRDGAFPGLAQLLLRSFLTQLKPELIAAETRAQLQAFFDAFGRPPDFVDGHQHVHLFPQIREAVLPVVHELAPKAWMRQCGVAPGRRPGWRDPKGKLLNFLSEGFRRAARATDTATNRAFAGTYTFRGDAMFAEIFPRFLDALPDGGVVMCHPGVVDDELRRCDKLTDLRAKEYAFFSGDEFPRLLAAHGAVLR